MSPKIVKQASGLIVSLCVALLLVLIQSTGPNSGDKVFLDATPALASQQPPQLPTLKPHPLPDVLALWEDAANNGDYFEQVQPLEVGYLVWSKFPVKVFVDSSEGSQGRWATAVRLAVQEWAEYLPLEIVGDAEQADITILRRRPPLRMTADGKLDRARSAETRYEYYTRASVNSPAVFLHRQKILISPLAEVVVAAAARHELGHALGIWGHSPTETDVLYYSQVRNPPSISARDINTLKRIYQQPTRLGWPVN
ncbi:peptidase [Ancylothrix sp. C2]|uniref:peptidase n=1 Tax=Ancylothrix sp. D3o TaxID=2953691 RepID=UPI0021BBA45D|nr:peptidase [Ancylothrix sp. D3o]MCT7949264.1 peptidase [Ancylothrix sp. D3o]